MITVFAGLHVYGARFSPSSVEALLGRTLDGEKTEPGEMSDCSSAQVAGSLIVDYSWDPEDPSFESGHADLLPATLPLFVDEQLVPALRKCGAESIILFVNVAYREQCNMELSPSLLLALATLGVTLAISCWEDDPDEETGPIATGDPA